MYFDYPLEQGLRQPRENEAYTHYKYFDYPLEQGLRQSRMFNTQFLSQMYFDYPLEQGLRPQPYCSGSSIHIVF